MLFWSTMRFHYIQPFFQYQYFLSTLGYSTAMARQELMSLRLFQCYYFVGDFAGEFIFKPVNIFIVAATALSKSET